MRRLRRALGILARTETKGLPAHFAAGAQVSERSGAAVSDNVASAGLKPAVALAFKKPLHWLKGRAKATLKPGDARLRRLHTVRSFGALEVAVLVLTNKMFVTIL
jgi:hypothetical protein